MRHALASLLVALLASACACAHAEYPDKPIRLVVPYPPGGSVDPVGRAIGQQLSQSLGQPVVVDNRPGAGGNLGTDLVAKAKPDGYTLLLGGIATHAISPNLYPSLPYDPVRDFTPVSLVASMPNVLVVHPSVQANSVNDLIALAKAHPRSLLFASAGPGTSLHLSAQMFQRAAGVELVHVPYKGSAAYMPDILSGKVQMVFDNISNALHQIEARKLRALAVTGARRSAALQDVPTMVELGFLGFEVLSWQAVFAPAGVPKDIIDRLNKAIVAAVHDDHVRAQLSRQGIEPTGSSSAELAAYLQVEKNRWGRIIREEGIKLEQ